MPSGPVTASEAGSGCPFTSTNMPPAAGTSNTTFAPATGLPLESVTDAISFVADSPSPTFRSGVAVSSTPPPRGTVESIVNFVSAVAVVLNVPVAVAATS
ncbi:hypothetical protein D3C73_903510 [compost metagenome]